MKLKQKTVFILENRNYLRKILRDAFEDRGFRVFDAATIEQAREIFFAHPEEFDLLILDMRLREAKTGADFGIEVRDSRPKWAPEFIIHSAYEEPKYYRLAFKLGAAAYLRKAEPPDSTNLIRHFRALALRRALSAERPGLTDAIQEIVRSSESQPEALDRFCERVLAPELEAILGGRFVLLIADEEGARGFASEQKVLRQGVAYEQLQSAVFGNLAAKGPVVIESEVDLPPGFEEGDEVRKLLASHPGSAFLRLADLESFKLSLGLIQEKTEDVPLPEDARSLAGIIDGYLRPAVLNHLVEITRLWTEEYTKRKTLFSTAASACVYLGQEIGILFEQAAESGILEQEGPDGPLRKLESLGHELRRAGRLLGSLSTPTALAGSEGAPPATVELRALVGEVWKDLVERERIEDGSLLDLEEGSCETQGRRDYLASAVSRILIWLARRTIETPSDVPSGLRASCHIAGERAVEIRFEDRSRRLSRELRQRLFAPFSASFMEPVGKAADPDRRLGLFLARALVQATGGSLEDRSEDLPNDIGHRLVMRLPRAA